ncbi:hypothetical protein F2Q68_00016819 [Brassica cretica]|uniref:Uncharacterized protein n=1 Tax=Brassica cretica TaxID=69181 RepID=A0A8S9HRZ7_BRACR|nr:hypothetical protein F2Q68_00016819 [Brassica cretica]
MFPKRRAKTNPLQHCETSSSPRTFQARNAAYERITNLQHRETSQTPEDSFFDEISFLNKNTFLEDQTVIRTNIFSKHIIREDSKRAKTNPLQHRETSSSPRTFEARNAAYERITNLQHWETSQTPEDSFFDEISFLNKNTFLEDQTVIRTNIFSKHILREDSKR